MKKIIYLIFIISIFSMAHPVFACRPVAGAVYPTPESVLSKDDTALGVYRITADGDSVPGILLVGNENSSMNMVFKRDTTSCSSRSTSFKKDEYIVAIFNKDDDTITTFSLDDQFLYSFSSQAEAMKKYNLLYKEWEEREENIVDENGNKTVVVYIIAGKTLYPGVKNDSHVRDLQRALKNKLNLGDEFKIDGSYGPATIKAVKQFQKSVGLKEDGIAGVLTQTKLATEMGAGGENASTTEENTEIQNTEGGENNTTSQATVNENTGVNDDIIDGQLKDMLLRAKKEIINYTLDNKNYTDAYALVSEYNNLFLGISETSDPLYKSSGGGAYFVYSVQLKNGQYICADNNYQKEITQKPGRPDMETDQVSC